MKFTLEQITEACARAAHEANRAYCLALGDTSQMTWEHASENIQDSARQGVRGAFNGNSPEKSHEGWATYKRNAGWIFGPVKSEELKQHPCLVPYDKLPWEQRLKDTIFLGTVRNMAQAMEFLNGQSAPDAPAVPMTLAAAAASVRAPYTKPTVVSIPATGIVVDDQSIEVSSNKKKKT